ncbi:MAG: metal ABC transporter permease [Acidimicrobiales bacterium]
MGALDAAFPPAMFSNPSVRSAAVVAAVVAVACAPVGVFTVMRGQSFAGHAFADITATGGSAAFLLGLSPLVGFAAITLVGGGAMELLGTEHRRGRDLATGIVLGSGLGLSALLLYLTTTTQSSSGAAVTVLFGSIFAVSPGALPLVAGLGGAALALVGLMYRPLLLSSVSPALVATQGPPRRAAGFAYTASLALSVALAAITIGAILSTALLVGPAAAALRFARSPGRAVAWAAVIGTVVTWVGIVLAYDSYTWPPAGRGWPVSFFVVCLVVVAYLLSHLRRRPRRERGAEELQGRRGRA